MIGKKVAFLSLEGTFRDYIITKANKVLVFADDANLEQASGCFILPLTAIGLLEEVEMSSYKTIVNTGASSNVGRIITKLCKDKGI